MGRTVITIVYVDDIILIEDHDQEIGKFKSLLTHEFEIKDLRNLKYFLGMEIVGLKMGIAIFQCKLMALLDKICNEGFREEEQHGHYC